MRRVELSRFRRVTLATSSLSLLALALACGRALYEAEPGAEIVAGEAALAGCSAVKVATVSASANDGNGPIRALDDNLFTWWGADGAGQWIQVQFASPATFSSVVIAWHRGNERTNRVTFSASADGAKFVDFATGTSTGKSTGHERYRLSRSIAAARYLRVTFNGNSQNNLATLSELKACAPEGGAGSLPPANLKIAFMGDTDTTAEGKRVLELIKAQGADAMVVAGDLDYSDGNRAANWEAQIDSVLSPNFPVFALRGNHDGTWTNANSYQARLAQRWNRLQTAGALSWKGVPGMKSAVTFKGVTIVTVAPSNGVTRAEAAGFIRSTFAADKSIWRVASWHENMPPYRSNAGCGSGGDLVGWEVFEEARKAGAFVLNGHNHAYGRTKLLSCTGKPCTSVTRSACAPDNAVPTVANVADPVGQLTLSNGVNGTNFVLLAGMGGHETGRVSQTGPWWAKQGGSSCEASGAPCVVTGPGAMFCTFNPGGADPRKASCQYLDINGRVADSFSMTSQVR